MCIHSTSFVHLVYIAFTQVLPMSPAHFCHLSQLSIAKQDWSHLLKSPASLCLARSLEVLMHNVYLCPQRLFATYPTDLCIYLCPTYFVRKFFAHLSSHLVATYLNFHLALYLIRFVFLQSTNHSPAYSHSCASTTMSPYKFSSHCFYSSSTYVTGGVLPPIPTDETVEQDCARHNWALYPK